MTYLPFVGTCVHPGFLHIQIFKNRRVSCYFHHAYISLFLISFSINLRCHGTQLYIEPYGKKRILMCLIRNMTYLPFVGTCVHPGFHSDTCCVGFFFCFAFPRSVFCAQCFLCLWIVHYNLLEGSVEVKIENNKYFCFQCDSLWTTYIYKYLKIEGCLVIFIMHIFRCFWFHLVKIKTHCVMVVVLHVRFNFYQWLYLRNTEEFGSGKYTLNQKFGIQMTQI
jgi:hypothetical protein